MKKPNKPLTPLEKKGTLEDKKRAVLEQLRSAGKPVEELIEETKAKASKK